MTGPQEMKTLKVADEMIANYKKSGQDDAALILELAKNSRDFDKLKRVMDFLANRPGPKEPAYEAIDMKLSQKMKIER